MFDLWTGSGRILFPKYKNVCPLTENGGEMARIKLFSKVQKQLRPYIEEMENAKMILSKEEKKKN